MAASLTPIHLLYVPTLNCNLGCRYCYLGHETDRGITKKSSDEQILETLETAVEKFRKSDYFPFNISLHGGEVTTLAPAVLESLFDYITRYYRENSATLDELGIKKTVPHIKTNLLNFHILQDLFRKYRVSVSGSVDLPLFLHEKYRTTKMGGSSLDRILENIRVLARYPHAAKISTTLFHEHFVHKELIADDIERLHYELGFDMNRFNIMFGFESVKSSEKFGDDSRVDLKTISEDDQVMLFEYLTERFTGTDLEEGLITNWFDEFTPDYCTNCFNCGEKFFLLQADGNLYSCVRGQGSEDFHYGNILESDVAEIMERAPKKISFIHKSHGFHEDCKSCDCLHICHTGCPFVKSQLDIGKSYTCRLQKRMYAADPDRYRQAESIQEREKYVLEYASDMHPNEVFDLRSEVESTAEPVVPNDFHDPGNSLREIISADHILKQLYTDDAFCFSIDGELLPLSSQILKSNREIFHLHKGQQLMIHIRRSIFKANCPELIRNTLYLQMLRDTSVVYGDEQRTKQEHTFTHQVFYNMLKPPAGMGEEYLGFELTGLFEFHQDVFLDGVLNNLFVTTGYLREYHYKKQKANGFYHIQALNLPFQNIEFFWDRGQPGVSQK